ncbi:arsenate reductase (glutaredoxin) [Ancylobacter sp. WKF20]|uniref:arsenate reductase (glutaredoxin) n=1 Tax=Ancylobacter sp. WKF20 TaxID=3039801 RepID=UPI00243468BF|nr:arsenate reductase (glutaredoxin) [Ancylobacter sp. WKF20]WGD30199.1 arsenate reductase (glutaredoxin) [Ancylobacter sp. WKF20]
MSGPMDIVIYHNPDCGTSRNALALIRHAGIEPHVVEYLKSPPSRALLEQLLARTGKPVRAALREKGTPFAELGLGDPALSDAQLIDAMMAHPILINRPLVVSPLGVKLCRPSETVLDVLPVVPNADIAKDDGTLFLRDEQVAATEPRLAKALRDAGLPTQDLPVSPGRFFSFRTLGGRLIGYGGFEPYGDDVLLRSLLVKDSERGQGLGRNMVLLLLSRAFDLGARKAWVLTEGAAGWFETNGFKAQPREAAPPAIAATPQAAALCPASARLLSRSIAL